MELVVCCALSDVLLHLQLFIQISLIQQVLHLSLILNQFLDLTRVNARFGSLGRFEVFHINRREADVG